MSSRPRILLIEDNDQNAYLATFLLEQAGMVVARARTGEEGLGLARENAHDLILLDIQLPEIDGYELARMLRADERLKGIPIIAITSFAMPAERQKAFASGCTGYIEKPIQPLTFAELIRASLKPV